MENNKVTEIRTSVIPQVFLSGWKENIDFQMALQVSPDTLGSNESAMVGRHIRPYIQGFLGHVSLFDEGNMWFIKINPDEPQGKSVEIDPCSDLWSKQSRVTRCPHEGFRMFYNAIDVATTTDISVDDSPRDQRPLHDFQAEDTLGIFTFSRSHKVIFTTSIQLSSNLPKRKPFIPPHEL